MIPKFPVESFTPLFSPKPKENPGSIYLTIAQFSPFYIIICDLQTNEESILIPEGRQIFLDCPTPCLTFKLDLLVGDMPTR